MGIPYYLYTVLFILSSNFIAIEHTVPAVFDVFAVAIKERDAFQQPQKCGWSAAWE
jgi:hypothetical protein